jgi:hypothetical protein
MKPIKYEIYNDYPVNLSELDAVKSLFTLEERQRMENRMKILNDLVGFKDIKDRALAEKMFELGYLAAHTFQTKELPTD